MGQKKRPTELRVLDGVSSEKRGMPKPPIWLKAEAMKEWKRLAPELMAEGLLTEVDRGMLVLLCQSWADYVGAIQRIQKRGHVFTTPQGFRAKNPDITIMNEAFKHYFDACKQFGLSPMSRTKLKLRKPKVKDEDKVASLRGRRDRLTGPRDL